MYASASQATALSLCSCCGGKSVRVWGGGEGC